MKEQEITLIDLLVAVIIEEIFSEIQQLIDALPTEEELEENKGQK